MAFGSIVGAIQNQAGGSPAQTRPSGGFGGIGSVLAPPSNGNSSGGGMAALMQQQAAQANQAMLSAQAQAFMNPSFDDAKTALTNSITNPAPRNDIQLNDKHQVVVLDTFMGGTMQNPAHGFGVADVIRQQTGLKNDQIALVSDIVPNFGTPSPRSLLTAQGDAPASERLDSYIETMVASSLSQTNGSLEAIANQDAPNLKGINYSTSGSDLGGFHGLNDLAIRRDPDGRKELTPEGKVIFEGLGLAQNTTPANLKTFVERGTARYQQVRENSSLIQGQVARHDAVSEKLKNQGVHYTVSSGNDGGLVQQAQDAGLNMSDQADDNIYSNEHNVTVGSLNTQGTADCSDDTVAAHTVMGPEVDFLASGVDRTVNVFGANHTVSGTSYAAPDINARLVNLSNQNPHLSTSAVQNLLHNSAGPSISGTSVSAVR